MKHLLTAIVCCSAVVCFGQGTAIHEYPWNPDWNNDNFVGSSDLTGFLSAFGSEFGNPPEPCDYDGTPLEELLTSVYNGDIILDSIFVEYQIEDVSTYYPIGCPDQLTDTLIVSHSIMLHNFQFSSNYWRIYGGSASTFHEFRFAANGTTGLYYIQIKNQLISSLGFIADGFFGHEVAQAESTPIPFPSDWFLDEEGIHIDSGWDYADWVFYANYLHILPYWHYAE